MINLGHSHPDYVYPNDQLSAKLALGLSAIMAILASVVIIAVIL